MPEIKKDVYYDHQRVLEFVEENPLLEQLHIKYNVFVKIMDIIKTIFKENRQFEKDFRNQWKGIYSTSGSR